MRGKFAQAFVVKLNPALVPVHFTLQFQAALLHGGDLMFQLRKPLTQLADFVLASQYIGRAGLDLVSQSLGGGLTFANFSLQDVELMASKLSVQVLQLRRELLVLARFPGLALQRTDLPFHLANEIGDAQQVLLGVFEFAQRFLLL